MKEKRNYSLTAKERKAKRNKAANSSAVNKTSYSGGNARENAEQAMLVSQQRSRKTAVIMGAVICVAVLLILAGLLVPVITLMVNPYRGYDDVIARFKLSNGMTLEYVIEEDNYDTAATNFIFLAKNGYFDNTVFFDAQEGWLRFGGYESQPRISAGSSSSYESTRHHAQNEKYCSKFKALANSSFSTPTLKFGYKLRADANGEKQSLLEQIGVLTYLYSDSSTEFQFSYTAQANNQVETMDSSGKKSRITLEPTMVGRALNDKTIDNIIAIAQTARPNESISTGALWRPPAPDVYIETVKVYNLDSSKWRDFDFISYMGGKDSSNNNRLVGWNRYN